MLSSSKIKGACKVVVKRGRQAIVFMMSVVILFVSGIQFGLCKTLTALAVDTLAKDSTQLLIDFDTAAVMPKAYQLEAPARLVLDFDKVANGLSLNPDNRYQGHITNIHALGNEEQTRLIVDLAASQSHNAFMSRLDGNRLRVNITNHPIPKGSPNQGRIINTLQPSVIHYDNEYLAPLRDVAHRYTPQAERYEPALIKLSYTRLAKQTGQLTLDLVDAQSVPNIERRGNSIVIRMTGARIPLPILKPHLMHDDLVDSITAVNTKNQSIITLSMHQDFEYKAYQLGKQLTVDISPIQLLQAPKLKKREYSGKPMSMDFQNVEIRSALHLLSEFTKMNIVASDAVTGQLTLNLINVPWDQALDLILKSKQLTLQKHGNVMLVTPLSEGVDQRTKAREAQQQLISRLPLRTEYVRLNYAKASDVLSLISQASRPSAGLSLTPKSVAPIHLSATLLSDRGTATVDKRTNTLILKDTAASLDNIHGLIAKIDIPVRQVMIEVRIVSATDSFSKELGVKWGVLSKGIANNDTLLVGGSQQTLTDLKQFTIDTASIKGQSASSPKYNIHRPDNLNVDLGVSNAAGRIAFGLLAMSDLMIDLELSAMQADGRGEVISTPKILTMDKQTAKVSSGTKIPYHSESEGGGTTTQFEEAVLSLEVTPNITPEGKIALQLMIENGRPNPVGQGIILIDTDTLSTNVTIEDGQTIVLGGIYRNQIFNNVEKVPFFGDLPYMGRLFKKDLRRNDKQELLIFVTPRLLYDAEIPIY